jgi:hypothetical protein
VGVRTKKTVTSCSEYYKCNRWDCKRCASNKIYWLRQQSVNFANLLGGQICYFTTVKTSQNIETALYALTHDKSKIKGYNARYNAKKEYFFTIAKHGFSEWHLHIISNFDLKIAGSHVEVVKNKKAVCLYLVNNLEWSLGQNYGSRRRYGASSLLYKQNMKTWFKTRIRLWNAITRYIRAMILLNAIVAMLACAVTGESVVVACSGDKSINFLQKFSPQKIRPPPIAING